jgi:FtsZ-binding cell division protein ZapB
VDTLQLKNTELHNQNSLLVQEVKSLNHKIDALQNQINSQGGSNQENDKLILQLRE